MPNRTKRDRSKRNASRKDVLQKVRVVYRIFATKMKDPQTKVWGFLAKTIKRRPFLSFLFALGVLILTILVVNFLFKPPEEKKEGKKLVKNVQVYNVGSVPKIAVQAQVEKSNVVVITSQMGGVVQQINTGEGQSVWRGTNLISLSSNYQGGNIFSLQLQLAKTQYKNVLDTFKTQKEIIDKQKEIAEKSEESQERLREITRNSFDETRSSIDLNESIISALNDNLSDLEASPSGNEALILSTKQMKSQFLSANNQLRSSLETLEFQSVEENPPAEIGKIQKEITLKQLELQQKALSLVKETSRLQVLIAMVNESLMFPSSPFEGVVQKVHVRFGQSVAPGTPLVTLSGNTKHSRIIAKLPNDLKLNISKLEPSEIKVGSNSFNATPSFISTEATDGGLYLVIYEVPFEFEEILTDKAYVVVEIPIGYPSTGETIPFVPLDSVFQTEDESIIYVTTKGIVESRKVSLGGVFGRFVEVKSGLKSGDQVITSRNVLAGDVVKITN